MDILKKSIFLSALAALLLSALPLHAQDPAAAHGDMKEYIFNVGQFDRLRVPDNVNVVYKCLPDSSGYVVYHGDVDFCDSFILTNNGGTLKIQVTTEDVGKPGLPTVYAYSDFLTEVENASDFRVSVLSPAPTPKLKISQVGNGTVVVDNVRATTVEAGLLAGMGNIIIGGSCRDASFRMVGTGMISADRLKADVVQCKILGSGSIGCWAESALRVRGIGSTKIYYKGDPAVSKKGGGKLFRME